MELEYLLVYFHAKFPIPSAFHSQCFCSKCVVSFVAGSSTAITLGVLPQEAFARESYEFRKQWQSDTYPKARLGNTKSRERFASAWLKEEGVKKIQ
uniref:Uncharacterized protein n=1 Tax=Candidozyma auris TaxID=498019 RepID=A0A0L0P215_CANAR